MDGGENGGRNERLAPVVPLFGDRSPRAPRSVGDHPRSTGDHPGSAGDPPRLGADHLRSLSERAGGERDETSHPGSRADHPRADRPRFGAVDTPRSLSEHAEGERDETSHPAEPAWNNTWSDDLDDSDGHRGHGDDPDADEASEREIAEQNLTRRLRTRSLSVAEARAIVAERALEPDTVEEVLRSFERRRYLDDAALAEQLVDKATRKGQGRAAIARAIEQRRIPREVVDGALAALPDDDAERALEFARSRVRTMEGLDRTVALRRLAGQLARRGYSSSALNVARQVLDEQSDGRGTVRFE